MRCRLAFAFTAVAAVSAVATDCPDALCAVAEANDFEASGGPEQVAVVGDQLGLSVGADVCIETNADGRNVDVQVYDVAMTLDAIKQGIMDELGCGDLCVWKKDGTLLSTGTLAAHGVAHGDNLYAVLRPSEDADVAVTLTSTLEGTTWAAKSWTGGAKQSGDPDPYDDESTIEISGGVIRWTNGGGGGPYAVSALPASRPPDNPLIDFLMKDGDLVVEFGYASPATIVYERQDGQVAESTSAYTCPEPGTTEVNHSGDFPGKISCGCERPDEHPHVVAEPKCRMCGDDGESWYYRIAGECQCVDRDTFAASGGCLAKATCFPDPTCAGATGTAQYDGTTASLEGVAWVAKSWSGAAECRGDPDPCDDESAITFVGGSIYFVNDGGGGPYHDVKTLPASVRSPDNEEIKFLMISEDELSVQFGYARPATIIYQRTGWTDVGRKKSEHDDRCSKASLGIVVVGAMALLVLGINVGGCATHACHRRSPTRRTSPIVMGIPVLEEGKAKGINVGVIDHKPAPPTLTFLPLSQWPSEK